MDALSLLHSDHRHVEKILRQLRHTTIQDIELREELFEQLRKNIKIHQKIEEDIFYSDLKNDAEYRQQILEVFEEHLLSELLLGEISALSYDDDKWMTKLDALIENFERHINEEENKIFNLAKKFYDQHQLDQIGKKLQQVKRELT